MTGATEARPRRRLSPAARRAVLTAHIIVSVGLLGDSAGFLAVAARGASTGDAELADACWELLEMFSFVFGIPLSIAALVTGVTLGIGTSWGVLRYPWTSAKLLLIVSVMLVGALVLPSAGELRSGAGDPQTWLIAGAAYDVVALSLATGLAVYKPGRRSWLRRIARRGGAADSVSRAAESAHSRTSSLACLLRVEGWFASFRRFNSSTSE